MAAGDITIKPIKITICADTGCINYAEQRFIEDADGNNQALGQLNRPGPLNPRTPTAFNDDDTVKTWADTSTTGKPQAIIDLATAMWTSARKTAFENANPKG